jgi:hypothetical protein
MAAFGRRHLADKQPILNFHNVCIAAKPQVMGPGLTNERTLSAVRSRIMINSSRCDTTLVAHSCNQHFSLEGDIIISLISLMILSSPDAFCCCKKMS